jgi:hypothetical protein
MGLPSLSSLHERCSLVRASRELWCVPKAREFLNKLLDLYSEVLGSVPSDRVDAADRLLHASLVSLVGASRFEQQR